MIHEFGDGVEVARHLIRESRRGFSKHVSAPHMIETQASESAVIHMDEWWNLPVSIDFFFFQAADVTQVLERAGFKIEDVIERDPYPEVEHQSKRAYIFCTKLPTV